MDEEPFLWSPLRLVQPASTFMEPVCHTAYSATERSACGVPDNAATGRFDHLSWLLKYTAVTTCAWRGTVAPSGARSLWLVRPSSNPRVSLNGVGGPAWAVSLPATKKRNFAVGSNGATSSSACPVAKMVRHSAVRPGSATDGLNSYVNRWIRKTGVPMAVTVGRVAGSGGRTATTFPPALGTSFGDPVRDALSFETDVPAST